MPIVFRSRVFSVDVGPHQFPDGREREIAVVRHAPSVVIVPMVADDRVMLIRQYRASVARVLWEIPAGGVNSGETPEQAAARECEEEIGLVPGDLQRIRSLFPVPGFCDEALIFFVARQLTTPPPDSTHRPDEDEDIETRIVSLAEARSMVARGDIIDLKTAYGLTLV